ncbi:MAG: type II toxin-antitoxin system VapC family toxin [Fimbriiglobus sp.]
MSRRYLLDSGPAQDFLFQRRGVEQRADAARKTGAKIGICTPILGEIIGGIEQSSRRDAAWAVVRPRLKLLTCWPYEQPAAMEYGRLVAELRRIGRPMQQIDIQIAAIAITLGDCIVITTDSDLSAVPGLTVENWSV